MFCLVVYYQCAFEPEISDRWKILALSLRSVVWFLVRTFLEQSLTPLDEVWYEECNSLQIKDIHAH